MDAFNFVFSLFGLLLGLGLSEVLGGFGAALQERHKLKLGWLTPLLGLVVLLDLTSFWALAWFVRKQVPANYLVLLCTLAITGIYYLAARLVFPHDRREWPDYDIYYFSHRQWVIGAVILCNALLFVGQLMLGFDPLQTWFDQLSAVVFFGSLVALMITRSQIASISLMIFLVIQYIGTAVYSFMAYAGP